MDGVGGDGEEEQQPQLISHPDSDLSPDHPSDQKITDLHSSSPPQESDELPHPPAAGPPTLTDELRYKIIKQVEYYLSDENLRTDKFLLKYLAKDQEGYVPVAVIASFKKMKKLTHHKSLIVAALKESSLLTMSSSGKKVKRIRPFVLPEVLDPELCTVLVENLPVDHTVENMKTMFCHAGIIKKITIHEENATRDPRKCSIEEKLLGGKLYAVVEYETVEAAEKAVVTLNNEHDWRHGMRVKLLKRRNTQKKKGHDPEKKHNVHVDTPVDKENRQSSEHHDDDTPDEEHPSLGEHQKDKNGNRGQNSRRSRKPKHHQGAGGMGHGTAFHNHGHGGEVSKPPPGPKMPDGTRGFTMGRGRPLS